MADEGLAGVWAATAQVGERVGGRIALSRDGTGLQADAFGRRAVAAPGAAVLDFGTGIGRLRAAFDGDELLAFWVQDKVQGLRRFEFATPVRFDRQAARHIGELRPLAPDIALQLVVRQEPGEGCVAFLRDPQRNFARRSLYAVRREGRNLTLAGCNTYSPRLTGTLDAAGGTFTMFLPRYEHLFSFARLPASDVPGFLPLPRQQGPYRYRTPAAGPDGWPVAAAVEVGADRAGLAQVVSDLAAADPCDPANPVIDAVLVARRGKLVLDEYFHGYTAACPHDIRSAGKTLVGLLAGIARDRGAINAGTKLYELFGQRYPDLVADQWKPAITLEHLLTMRAGYDAEDHDPRAPGDETRMIEQSGQPDWTRFTLDLPMVAAPGGPVISYSSATTNLAAAAVAEATGAWLPAFFDEHVARPLEFGVYHWPLTPTGEGFGGGGMYLRPRDLAKIGQALLGGGLWKGRRIVSQDWVETATLTHGRYPNSGEDGSETFHGYGYAMQTYAVRSKWGVHQLFAALGNGGQMAAVIPDFELVVAFTGANYNDGGRAKRYLIRTVIEQGILPTMS